MDWYYTLNKQRRGPVDQKAFEQLVSRGEVTAETLVWRKGMPHWVPYSTLDSVPAPVPAPAPIPAVASTSAAATGPVCSRCGGTFAANDLVQLYGRSLCAKCKPVEVQVLSEGAPANAEMERIRKQHIRREVTIKRLGFAYLLSGVLTQIYAVLALLVLLAGAAKANLFLGALVICINVVWGIFAIRAGWGVRKLDPSARVPAIVLAIIGLLAFPVGTISCSWTLFLLLTKRGVMVFTDEYKQVIKETPHIKLQTSVVAWILLGLVLAFFGYLFYLQYRGSATP